MTGSEQQTAAKEFVSYWEGRGDEKGESQKFWLSLLGSVFGVTHPEQAIEFEDRVMLDHTSFIDGYIPGTKVLIEQKKLGKDLNASIRQSDGTSLTPFQQAKRYSAEMPYSRRPRWIVTCNFERFHVYDMENPSGEPEIIELKELPKEYYRLAFLVDSGKELLKKEEELSIAAGDVVGKMYDALLKQYKDPTDKRSLRSLNILCVRLVFCLYAEDAGIFGSHTMFHDYMAQFPAKHWRRALAELFEVLDKDIDDRDDYITDDLGAFPYVNGGLFKEEDIEIPNFTDEIVDIILRKASEDFDWSEISPTIFGAVFESTINPEVRRNGGMHYTSILNLHKAIDPLFLDGLKEEFASIVDIKVQKTREAKLKDFQKKLSELVFLDPASGSGNFLTEAYICIRRLENQILQELSGGQMVYGDVVNPIMCSIQQFYGIEINDFAVSVAKTALWIAESQMKKETEEIMHMQLEFLPLQTNAYIREGNSLLLDWNEVVHKSRLNYIMGNPPFVGARLMSDSQKADVLRIFGKDWKNVGNLDYVTCWYKKAAEMMKGTAIRAALVSTNSVSQGETVANLWEPLFKDGVYIDFAHRTFRWDSEAKIKAHVHCVIIGFSMAPNKTPKRIFAEDSVQEVKNINGYLVDAENIFIESRNKPICNVAEIGIGNKPIDGGFYLFSKEEMAEFLQKEPQAGPYFHPWYGSKEFINQCPRYCLYLGDCQPSELRKMPESLKRIQAVKEYRLSSPSEGTRKLAETPARFHVTNMPSETYIVVPKVSSERRSYIPMGFMTPDILCSDLVFIIPNASLYHFGILMSNVHMAWVRAVCGRLKSDFRYSKDIVYNNFPWPQADNDQKEKIAQTAQGILDARNLFPESSLADLYDPLTMPKELKRAHDLNNLAVMAAYGFKKGTPEYSTESACVAALMRKYKELTK